MPSTTTTRTAIEISSHRLARVSQDLRSSTDTSRRNGVGEVEERSRACPSWGAVVLTSLHLRAEDPPEADHQRDHEPDEPGHGEVRPVLRGHGRVHERRLGVVEVDPRTNRVEPAHQLRAELEETRQHEG